MLRSRNFMAGLFKGSLITFAAVAILAGAAFAQTGGVKGKVRNNRGDGIPNATVTARKDGTDVKTVTADRKGDFVLSGLAPGKYNFVFDADGYGVGIKYNVEVKSGIVDLGSRLFLTPDQGQLVFVRGSVFYREGTSITGAKVELHEVNADGTTKKLDTVYTNISGDFTFRRPNKNVKYRVVASFKDARGENEITVDNPGIYRTAITLDIPRTVK